MRGIKRRFKGKNIEQGGRIYDYNQRLNGTKRTDDFWKLVCSKVGNSQQGADWKPFEKTVCWYGKSTRRSAQSTFKFSWHKGK